MNIGETSAILPVTDALAPVAAPAESAAGFADRLAEAMGEAAAPPVVNEDAPLAVATTGVPVALATTGAALPVALVLLGMQAAQGAVVPESAAMAADEAAPDEGLGLGLVEGVVGSGEDAALPPLPETTLVDGKDAAGQAPIAADEDVPAVADENAVGPVPEGVETGVAVVATPVATPVAAAPVVAPVVSAGADGPDAADAGGLAVATAAQARRGALFAAAGVGVKVEAGFAAVDNPAPAGQKPVAHAGGPAGEGKSGKGKADDGAVPDGAAPEKPAKAKAAQAAPLPEPVAARVIEMVPVAAPVAQKTGVAKDSVPDAAGPLVQQMPQPLPQMTERAPAPPLRTDLPGWEKVLSDRIAAELSDDGQEIELSLSPEKLGPLRIKLEMVDGLAQVRIITATPEAARIFNEAQHRLTEGLARAGVDLGSQSAQSEGQGAGQHARQGGQAEDRSAARNRMTDFMTHARRIEAGDAPALRRAGAGLVNLMA